MYSVLTRLPLQPKIVPAEAKVILDTNIIPLFKRVQVTGKLYEAAINRCVELGLSGGIIYDALLLLCAKSVDAERIYTFNVRDFQRLMPDVANRISAP
jgi:predicted nucleic acid-binding protein